MARTSRAPASAGWATRRKLILALAVGVVVFFVVSILLARAFNADSAERAAITSLMQAQARGDAAGAARLIQGCPQSATCRATVLRNAAALRHPGSVSIIQLQPSTGFSLTGTTGVARVAWSVGGSLPIVQCVRVQRTGNVISGLTVRLLAVTVRLPSSSGCPSRF